ncbi:DUF3782 domain-containing protein [Candidatus Bathyarchaeota archaeon]|nr:DUF3782 domain-containing protein [Candidatus Bathyarchaeota archaeon]
MTLKEELLGLLERDKEFRYAVVGLIGLEEILKRLDRNEEILMRHEKILMRHEEILLKHSEELLKLREDMMEGFRRHDEELAKLRSDMNRGFELMERHISALGARWGLMAEEAFREGLRGLLEREFKFKVDRWSRYDEAGIVYGYPSNVEVDVAASDGRHILIEVASHVRAQDIYLLKRKAEFYEKETGEKPRRLIVVTPYAEDKAKEACLRLGIELYTKV